MTARQDRVPDWLLERLVAGELPAAQATELRAALHERGEDERLTALAGSNAKILAALPPAEVVAEVERRAAARRESPIPNRRPLFALSLAAACAAGLVVLAIVRDQPGTGTPPQDEVSPEHIGVRGEPSLLIHRKTKSGAELVRDNMLVHRGDTLQLGYVARGKRFGVIASIDARGTFTLHLPEAPGAAAALERGGEHALPHAYELDDSPGFERFVFVTSDQPFTTADVAAAMTNGRALPASFTVKAMTLTKETP